MENMPALVNPLYAFDASFSKPVATTIAASIAAKGVSAEQKGRGREPPLNNSWVSMHKSFRSEVREIIRRIDSLEAHFYSEGIANLVMRLLAILEIVCSRDDDSILRVVDMLVSIICFCYDKISKIFATMPLSELSFHQLSSLFGHSEYRIELFKELAIIGISEDDTKNLFCSKVADPTKNFFYIFAGRIVPSQVKIREMISKRSQPVVPVDKVQEVQVDPTVLTEQQRKQELHNEFLNILN
jgi:hypothetical protein